MLTVCQSFPSMAINDSNKFKKSLSTSIENNNVNDTYSLQESNNNVDNNSYPKAVNPTDIVYIPDPDLKAAINKTLDIKRDEGDTITKADMEKLTKAFK